MEIIFEYVKEASLEAFADEYDLDLRVVERSKLSLPSVEKYYSHFQTKRGEFVEIAEGGMLISATGNGNTPAEAIADFGRRISERRLKFSGRYVTVPRIKQGEQA